MRELAERIREKIDKNKNTSNKTKQITFVKEGEKSTGAGKPEQSSILSSASDWILSIDLEGRLKIPADISVTNLRPDITIKSNETKQLILIELTVPTEERIEISGELKKTKYAPIVEEGRKKGWGVSVWAVEVGCRGFPARSLSTLLRALGYGGKERKQAMNKLGEKAEEASRAIWSWSNMKEWGRKQK